jgi:hypothetical protein
MPANENMNSFQFCKIEMIFHIVEKNKPKTFFIFYKSLLQFLKYLAEYPY